LPFFFNDVERVFDETFLKWFAIAACFMGAVLNEMDQALFAVG
jgi:hypothetical protein